MLGLTMHHAYNELVMANTVDALMTAFLLLDQLDDGPQIPRRRFRNVVGRSSSPISRWAQRFETVEGG